MGSGYPVVSASLSWGGLGVGVKMEHPTAERSRRLTCYTFGVGRGHGARQAAFRAPKIFLVYVVSVDGPLIVSIVALAVSAASLGISTFLALRQAALLKDSNLLPVTMELLAEFRNAEFHDRYRFVVEKLREEYEPELGVFGFPEPARCAVLDIAYYFQTFAALEGFGIVYEPEMLRNLNTKTVLNVRAIEVWECVGPYVLVERARSPGAESEMLTVLDAYVHKLRSDLSKRRVG